MVVDLDGTLIRTDSLWESALLLIRSSPASLFNILFWLAKGGKSGLKEELASRAAIDVDTLPVNEALLSYLEDQHRRGRTLILATAAHRRIADRVATRFKLFATVLATERGTNLKGIEKLRAIQEAVGANFSYAGDSAADLPIWRAAQSVILVEVSRNVRARLGRHPAVEQDFHRPSSAAATWLGALRAHQWIKNTLLAVPLLTSFSVSDGSIWISLIVAFLAFSLTASATYIANDLGDLASDRAHPRKRLRAFAAGALPIAHGIAAAAVLLVAGLLLGAYVSAPFFGVLLLYVSASVLYSWRLKRQVLLDVIVLSLLYTLRIIAGAIATHVHVSSWLLAFSVFVFLSLALVKRCSELVSLGQLGRTATQGRDYRLSDLVVLWPLGVAASTASIVVFGLFISAPESQQRYALPELLWGVALILTYWMGRLWIKTARGEMHDDPIVYALRDRSSQITLLVLVVTVIAARVLKLS